MIKIKFYMLQGHLLLFWWDYNNGNNLRIDGLKMDIEKMLLSITKLRRRLSYHRRLII